MSKNWINTITIRNYQYSDYGELKRFWQLNGLDSPKRADDQYIIQRTLDHGGVLLVMIHEDGRLIGSSWITEDGRRSWIHHFGIHPDLHGQGLGKLLMERTMIEIRRIGLQVKLEVHHNNLNAIGLYRKYGFKLLDGYLVYMVRSLN
ncbi:MAG: GNAT family N-acetyltransferase [Bacteroidales bacterium]|nr:GNAT family N-acetyltransferase [Bacteroidales bacterium]